MADRKNKTQTEKHIPKLQKSGSKAKPLLVITALSLTGMGYGCDEIATSNPTGPWYDSGLDSNVDDASPDQDAQPEDAATDNDAGTE